MRRSIYKNHLLVIIFLVMNGSLVAENIQEKKEILLGISSAKTGSVKELGRDMSIGSKVFFDQINQSGGVNGYQIRTINYDDGYEPEKTIENIKTLMSDNVLMFFGFMGTPTSKVAMPIAVRAKIPFFAPLTGAEFLRNPVNRYVFNVRAGYFDETEELVNYLVDVKGLKRIALFIQNDGYGAAGRTGVQLALEKRGVSVVAVGKYERNTTDVDQALAKVMEANPDAVIIISAYGATSAFIHKALTHHFNPVFATISVGTEALIEALGNKGDGVIISQVMPNPESDHIPLIKGYRAAMTQAGYQERIGYASLEGYINAYVLSEGLKLVEGDMTRENVITALEKLNISSGGVDFVFSPYGHQALTTVYLTKVKNGKVEQITD